MSGSTNNFPPVPTRGYSYRRPGEGYDAGASNATDWNIVHAMFPRPHFRVGQNSRGGFQVPWLPMDDERVMGGTWGSSRFPEPPISPLPLRVDEIARNNIIHPRPRQSIPEPPPRFIAPSLQLPTEEEESRLSQDEQKKALKMLKKEIYNPTPKRIAKRLSLYYRDSSANATAKNSRFDDKGEDEYEEKCAICLDDFEPKQQFIRTPCNHMFHEECIVPWVKSHGQCPVCRFAICERMGEKSVPRNNNNARAQVPVDLWIELLSWDI